LHSGLLWFMTIATNLLRKFQKGDQQAFSSVYDIYKKRIMGICYRYGKNKEDAEDIFQEAFIKIFQNCNRVKNLDAFEGWMIRTVVNTAVNFYHKNKRLKDNEILFVADRANEDHKFIIEKLSMEALIKLVQKLPDGYRLVFNLNVVDGYSHQEIGEMFGFNESTSRSQLSRAKKLLQTELQKIGISKYENFA